MTDTLDPLEPSPYKVLNVPKDANLATIRSAHRKLVLACHPDKVLDEAVKQVKAEQFHQVQHAYEVLSDDTRRKNWDDRARLAESRADVMEDRRGPSGPPPSARRRQDYTFQRAASSPIFEMRGGRVYEERMPKYPPTRGYEEEIYIPKHSEPRPNPQRYDSRYMDTPTRKASGRSAADDRRRAAREPETPKERQKRAKEEEAAARDQRNRRRDRDRRRASEAKFHSRAAYVEEEDEAEDEGAARRGDTSDSDAFEARFFRMPDYNQDRRSRGPPRTSSWKAQREYDDELDRKLYDVHDYMTKSRESVDSEPRRSRRRAGSNVERPPPPPPSPPPPPETGRRSSGDDIRRGSGRSRAPRPSSPTRRGSKDKRADVLDPPPPSSSSSRKPSLPNANSDPRGLKPAKRHDPARTATYTPTRKPSKFGGEPHPGIKRAETMPVRSSHLKNMKATSDVTDSDSGDSSDDSDATPIISPAPRRSGPRRQQSSTKTYKVHDERTVLVEPDSPPSKRDRNHDRDRDRDAGRDNSRRGSTDPQRPSLSGRMSSTRTPPTRSASHMNTSTPLKQNTPRHTPTGSGSGGDRLFGEFVSSPVASSSEDIAPDALPSRSRRDRNRERDRDAAKTGLPYEIKEALPHRPATNGGGGGGGGGGGKYAPQNLNANADKSGSASASAGRRGSSEDYIIREAHALAEERDRDRDRDAWPGSLHRGPGGKRGGRTAVDSRS